MADLMRFKAKLADALQERKLEWWEQCMLQGETQLLRRLLERRFGPLPPWADQKIAKAPEADLIHWGERILDTTLSLDQLLTR
jgi:hypothetical protein